MRILFVLTLLFSATTFAQKTPIGLIVKFVEGADYSQQSSIINPINELNTLKQGHLLTGFDVTLVEGNSTYSVSDYQLIQEELEESDLVEFTSILYRTAEGGVGGDLQQLSYKLKDIPSNKYDYRLAYIYPEPIAHHFLADVYVETYTKHFEDIRTVQAAMLATGKYEFVSVNTLHTILATVDDPYFENQWAVENLGGPLHYDGTAGADMAVVPAWDITTGDPSIKIAVLDSGTDTNHVDLVGNLLPGFDATGGGSQGYPNTEFSNDGHGTCCAGIIGAIGDNSEGIAGVAYACKIIPVKIFYYVEFGGEVIPFSSSTAGQDGIIWAVTEGKADILSNSWGVRDSDIPILGIDTVMGNMIISENIENGREGKGTPMLFSSGNEGDSFSIWPAAHPKTISVGASTMCDELKTPTDCSPEGWWGSNYGENLDVTAPGVKVLATDMTDGLGYNGFADNNYSMFNGTSAACPNAAGVMALILSVDPELSAYDARAILAVTANKVGGYAYDSPGDFGLWSEEMGYGRVNAYDAVYYASNWVELNETTQMTDFIAYANNETTLVLEEQFNSALTVFNLQGQELCHFDVGTLPSNSILLNEFVNTSGLYFVRVQRGDLEVTLKAVVKK